MSRPLIAVIFGTRPEAIKMAPVVNALRQESDLDVLVCSTGQHKEMLDQVLNFFSIEVDERFDAMAGNTSLGNLTARLVVGLEEIFIRRRPHLVLVHGDTATTLAASLAAYYTQIPVAHVEAGLRTYDKLAPWPEEINRRMTGTVADLHFAPTPRARENLLRENIDPASVHITGNTVIDALHMAAEKLAANCDIAASVMDDFPMLSTGRRLILVTGHRRENFGIKVENICRALLHLADREDVFVLYPVHLNPNINDPVRAMLGGHPNIQLSAPLDYPAFVALLQRAYLVLTDSGGIQEEAPGFGKPVLVMRDTTERPEAVEAGVAILVGTDQERIINEAERLLDNPVAYQSVATAVNPFGDGHASSRIVHSIRQFFSSRDN